MPAIHTDSLQQAYGDVTALDGFSLSVAEGELFGLLGPAVGLGLYALALAWQGSPPLEAVAGAILLVGVACYIFGVTVYLTGLSPGEFLFDTALYAVFGAAMVVPLVPVLLAGFALELSPTVLGGLTAVAVLLGAAGLGLYRQSVPKWTARYRE